MDLIGIFAGTVENNSDPEHIGRLKIRVPHVYGSLGSPTGSITTDNLPWALSMGSPAGLTTKSGGIAWLPEIGDQVLVQFLDGEPEKPVWTWFTQTPVAAKDFTLYRYKADGTPASSALARYGHSLQFTKSSINATTHQGYQLLLDDSTGVTGGSCVLNTPVGQALEVNDFKGTAVLQALKTAVLTSDTVILNAGSSLLLNANTHMSVMCAGAILTINSDGSFLLCLASGASIIADPTGNVTLSSSNGDFVSVERNLLQVCTKDGTGIVIQPENVTVNASNVAVNATSVALGETAVSSLVLTDPLVLWLNTHVHSSAGAGTPTSPPIVPVVPQVIGSTTASAA